MRVLSLTPAAAPAVFDPTTVEVWQWPDVDPLPGWVDPHSLTSDELARADRTRHERSRNQFIRCRLLLRALLAARLNCLPGAVRFTVGTTGKPFLADPSASLFFNVSHTDGLIVVAMGAMPLGIDVEADNPDRDRAGLVDRFFAPEEQKQYRSLPEGLKAAAFLRGWTCKEALLKGTGAGVRDLQNCAVDLDPRQPARVIRHVNSQPWQLAVFAPVVAGIAGAIAVATTGRANVDSLT